MADRIQRALVVTAHPDDSEFGAGGTVAKLVREGKQVTYCILTNGDKGSGDRAMTPQRLVAIREQEQRNAARVLGVDTVDFLGFPDCELEDTREHAGPSRRRSGAIGRTCSSPRTPTGRRTWALRTAITAPPPGSPSTVCTLLPAITWRFRSCSSRGSSRTR